ncbi:lithostathine-1-alpha-like [Festucalex cinctus]
MAFAVCSFFLLCGINGLLTGVWPLPLSHWKIINCPDNTWTQLDCYCFRYQDTAMSFVDAEAACIALDGNLASVRSDLENALIVQLITAGGMEAQAWIGLHDAIKDDDFIWTDGSFGTFQNFDSTNTEPENSGDCVEIKTSGLWRDDPCSDTNTFVCIVDLCNGGNPDNPNNCT